jgi:hypothetical protein
MKRPGVGPFVVTAVDGRRSTWSQDTSDLDALLGNGQQHGVQVCAGQHGGAALSVNMTAEDLRRYGIGPGGGL